MRTVRLYLDLLWMDLYARSQYRVDFLLGLSTSLLEHGVTLGTLWLIFQQVPSLGGWNNAQAAVLYSLLSLCMGLVNLLAPGLRMLPYLVEQGELDGILVLPASPYVQMLPRFSPNAAGDLLLGIAVLAISGRASGILWTPLSLLFLLFSVVCGTAVLLGLLTAVYSLSFWVRKPGITHGVEELAQMARYPAGIYPRWVQIVITWVFPVTFASYYPAAVLTKATAPSPGYPLLALGATAMAVGAGVILWRLGLRKYEGSGS